jgi:hypothetical protein
MNIHFYLFIIWIQSHYTLIVLLKKSMNVPKYNLPNHMELVL